MKASNRGNVIFKIVCISLYLPFYPLQSKKNCKSMFHISVFVNSRDKPRAHESLQYAVPTWNNQIHSSLEKKKTIVTRSFKFTAKSSGNFRKFSNTSGFHSLLDYQHSHQSGVFVTVDESVLTRHHHPKSTVYIRDSLLVWYIQWFWQIYNDTYPLL